MNLLLFAANALFFTLGQVALKLAVSEAPRWPRWLCFAAGIAGMACSFFLGLGLLQRFELSYFFPLQAANVIIVVLASAWLLNEELTPGRLWGTALVAAGIAIVGSGL